MITKDTQQIPSRITRGATSAHTPADQAALFNAQFTSCFTPRSSMDLTSILAAGSASVEDDIPHLSSASCSSMDVAQIITKLRYDVASGPDGILSPMLKGTSTSISLPLSNLFNASFNSGLIPSEWKSSRVVPIPKSGDTSEVANYRPISLLPSISKIQERVVHNILLQHVTQVFLPIWLQARKLYSRGHSSCHP